MFEKIAAQIALHPWGSVIIAILIGGLAMLAFLAIVVPNKQSRWIVTNTNFEFVLRLILIGLFVIGVIVVVEKILPSIENSGIPMWLMWTVILGFVALIIYMIMLTINRWKKSNSDFE